MTLFVCFYLFVIPSEVARERNGVEGSERIWLQLVRSYVSPGKAEHTRQIDCIEGQCSLINCFPSFVKTNVSIGMILG